MKVSPSLVSVSAAIISLSLNATVHGAVYDHKSFILEEDLCSSRTGISYPSQSHTLENDEWEEANLILTNAEISAYDRHKIGMEKAWERAGGAGTYFPGREEASLQKWGRRLVSAGKFTLKLAAPFVVTAAANEGTEQLFSYATPLVKKYVGDKAVEAITHPCPLNPPTWWESHIPYKEAIARDMAETAAVDLMNGFKETTQTYSAPLAVGVYTVGSTFYTNAIEPLGKRISRWF